MCYISYTYISSTSIRPEMIFLKSLFTDVLCIKYKGKTILYGELLRKKILFYLSDKIEISY